jgi:hypothetical protein
MVLSQEIQLLQLLKPYIHLSLHVPISFSSIGTSSLFSKVEGEVVGLGPTGCINNKKIIFPYMWFKYYVARLPTTTLVFGVQILNLLIIPNPVAIQVWVPFTWMSISDCGLCNQSEFSVSVNILLNTYYACSNVTHGNEFIVGVLTSACFIIILINNS